MNPEKQYRRALVKKHIFLAKMMRREILPLETVDRERALVRIMWNQYRQMAA